MSVELGLFCRGERGADILSKGGGGAGKAKGTLGLELNGRGAGEAFEKARDSALVFELLENFQTFAVEGVGGGAIALLSCQVSEIGERAGDAPAIAESRETSTRPVRKECARQRSRLHRGRRRPCN